MFGAAAFGTFVFTILTIFAPSNTPVWMIFPSGVFGTIWMVKLLDALKKGHDASHHS